MQEIIFNGILIILALFVASFLNVAAIRIPLGQSIVFPASHCMKCEHKLSPLDLIPIFSFVFLGGKCRYCNERISPIYPLGEIITTFLLLFTYYKIGLSLELWVAIPLVMFLSVITWSDLLYHIIPNKVNLFVFIYFIVLHFFYHPLPVMDYLLGFVLGGGLLLLIAVISRGGMGGGDVKLMAVIGMAIGWKLTFIAFFLASAFGTFIGIGLLVAGVVKRGQPVPFGPFLAAGILLSYFYGLEWFNLYMNYTFQ